MKIPVIIPYTDHREIEEIAKVVASGWVAQGPKVAEFEKAVAAHEGVRHGVATASCTTALHLLMHGLGIGAGQDVLVPSFTFVATANSVAHTGARPRFVDVLPETFCIDPVSVEATIADNYASHEGKLVHKRDGGVLSAMVVVHQFGLCADMPRLTAIAQRYHLRIVEDAACALGASIGDIHEGGFGNPSCVSFHPRKSITTGEGGMILTQDDGLATRLRMLRTHGASTSEVSRHQSDGFLLPAFSEIGYNYRMTDIQAAMGLAQMEKIEHILEVRRSRAARYDELLSGLDWLTTPVEPEGYFHTYQSYVCMLRPAVKSVEAGGDLRNQLLSLLAAEGVSTRQGTHACHLLECYQVAEGMAQDSLPNAYACDRLSLTLPLYVQMTDAEQDYVVEKLKEAYTCLTSTANVSS